MDGIGKTKANLAEEIEDLRQMVEDFREGDKQIQLLSSITEQVADSVITTDLDYKITYVNPSFQKMYGYSRDELLGQSTNILNASPNSDQIQKDIYETVSPGGVWRGEVVNRRKDGSIFSCELTVFPLKDKKGKDIPKLPSETSPNANELSSNWRLQKHMQKRQILPRASSLPI